MRGVRATRERFTYDLTAACCNPHLVLTGLAAPYFTVCITLETGRPREMQLNRQFMYMYRERENGGGICYAELLSERRTS